MRMHSSLGIDVEKAEALNNSELRFDLESGANGEKRKRKERQSIS